MTKQKTNNLRSKLIRLHAKRRGWERYGVRLTNEEYRDLIRQIQAHDSMFIVRRTNRYTRHIVWYQGLAMLVGYDSTYKQITTFLPLSAAHLTGDKLTKFMSKNKERQFDNKTDEREG